MKTAKVEIACVYLYCPECGEGISHPEHGSYLFSLQVDWPQDNTVECDSCGAKVKLPKIRGAVILESGK